FLDLPFTSTTNPVGSIAALPQSIPTFGVGAAAPANPARRLLVVVSGYWAGVGGNWSSISVAGAVVLSEGVRRRFDWLNFTGPASGWSAPDALAVTVMQASASL